VAALEAAQAGSAAYIPPISERAWRAFWDLDQCRARDFFAGGSQAITFPDIAAFQQVAGFRLRGWERSAILRMDRARLAFLNMPPDQRPAPVSSRPVTPDLFCALFE